MEKAALCTILFPFPYFPFPVFWSPIHADNFKDEEQGKSSSFRPHP
jgi:hypothetical protein